MKRKENRVDTAKINNGGKKKEKRKKKKKTKRNPPEANPSQKGRGDKEGDSLGKKENKKN